MLPLLNIGSIKPGRKVQIKLQMTRANKNTLMNAFRKTSSED